MMINIIGINFEKYGILKSIEKYCETNFVEFKYINFLTKSNLDVLSTLNCDIAIYVEIEPIGDTVPHVIVKEGVDGRTIAADLKRLIKSCKLPEPVQVTEEFTKGWSENPAEEQLPEGRSYTDPDTMRSAMESVMRVVQTVKKEELVPPLERFAMNLDGVNINVNGQIVRLNREDFSKFLELKELTESLGYEIESVVVS